MIRNLLQSALFALEPLQYSNPQTDETIAQLRAAVDPNRQAEFLTFLEGTEVSLVSTGEHDASNRLFGTVSIVQWHHGKNGVILLVQDPTPNFTQKITK